MREYRGSPSHPEYILDVLRPNNITFDGIFDEPFDEPLSQEIEGVSEQFAKFVKPIMVLLRQPVAPKIVDTLPPWVQGYFRHTYTNSDVTYYQAADIVAYVTEFCQKARSLNGKLQVSDTSWL